jgi:hypothetical protein
MKKKSWFIAVHLSQSASPTTASRSITQYASIVVKILPQCFNILSLEIRNLDQHADYIISVKSFLESRNQQFVKILRVTMPHSLNPSTFPELSGNNSIIFLASSVCLLDLRSI